MRTRPKSGSSVRRVTLRHQQFDDGAGQFEREAALFLDRERTPPGDTRWPRQGSSARSRRSAACEAPFPAEPALPPLRIAKASGGCYGNVGRRRPSLIRVAPPAPCRSRKQYAIVDEAQDFDRHVGRDTIHDKMTRPVGRIAGGTSLVNVPNTTAP